MSAVYGRAVKLYLEAGWRGVLPLPARQKKSPPSGFTGRGAPDPTLERVETWAEDEPGGNIALRLPDGVLGIDVDVYAGGDTTMKEWAERYGELPPTVRTTSRDDGSGILLYRVPTDQEWKSELGAGVQVIQRHHRYAVVWPSIHPDTAGTYRWMDADDNEVGIPRLDELPELPLAWVEALDAGLADDRPKARTTHAAARQFLRELPAGRACAHVTAELHAATESLAEIGGRHDATTGHVLALVRFGETGCPGVRPTLGTLRDAFTDAISDRAGEHDAEAEFNRMLIGAVALVQADPTPEDRKGCDTPLLPAYEEFWTARPAHAQLRAFARRRMVSPWAMLGSVLALVDCHVGPHVQLPDLVGSYGSLNVLVGLIGPPGSGKDAADRAARDFLWADGSVPIHKLGTGQGIAAGYTRLMKDPVDNKRMVPTQYNDTALYLLSEIDTLKAHAEMGGSTVLADLRSAFMGEALGEQYAAVEKRRPVGEQRYRFALSAGIQPKRSGVLLHDVDGGTPQRWLWLPVIDPYAQPGPFPEALPLDWHVPEEFRADGPHDCEVVSRARHVLDVCETAVREIRHARYRRLSGAEQQTMDGHRLFTKEKVAALLAFLDGRFDGIGEDDWRLAETVMQVSAATRAQCEKAIAGLAQQRNRARGVADAERHDAAEERGRELKVQRVAATLRGKLSEAGGDGWTARSELRRGLPSRDRDVFDEAIRRLVSAGQAEQASTSPGHGEDGLRYRLRR